MAGSSSSAGGKLRFAPVRCCACFCGRTSHDPDPIHEEEALAWAEYEKTPDRSAAPGSEGEVVTKGRADLYCFNTARRHFGTVGRSQLKKLHETNAEWKASFEEKRQLVISAMREGKVSGKRLKAAVQT
eukprot:5303277-Alexandrium_andersonii.AAC.1